MWSVLSMDSYLVVVQSLKSATVPLNFTACSLCNFKPIVQSNSTARDAIFMAVTQYGQGVERLVRSIRTTGCQATIVIFTVEDCTFPQHFLDCNVKIVIVEPLSSRAAKSPYKMRWEWYYLYLKDELHKYDRIFHTDAFDAFFFGDPFSMLPDRNSLYFQMEDRSLRSCPYNKDWVLSCHHDVNRWKLLGKTIACSGSLAGGAQAFYNFTKILITHNEWPSCWGKGFDQGDFNYVLYTKYIPSNASHTLMNCNSGFLTMNYCSAKGIFFNSLGQLLTPDKSKLVTFVHQYNRYENASKVINALCPPV